MKRGTHINRFIVRTALFTLTMLFLSFNGISQSTPETKPDTTKKTLQFSGMVIDQKTGEPMPFVTILIRNRMKGTVSDKRGFFSFVVMTGDTIRFSSLGYKRSFYVIPDSIENNSLSVIQPLESDAITLKPVRVWPWANKEQFRQEFLSADLPDSKENIARKNLEAEMMAELAANMKMDGSENQRNFIQQEINKTYFAGSQQGFMQMGGPNAVPIPTTLLNPIAWAKFIDAIKRGDFNKKKKKKTSSDD